MSTVRDSVLKGSLPNSSSSDQNRSMNFMVSPNELPHAAFVSLVVCAITVAWLFIQRGRQTPEGKRQRRRIHSLPTRLPVLGDVPEFLRNAERVNDWMAERSLDFDGEPWRIHVPVPGMKNIVVVPSPELVHEVLVTQFENFLRGRQQIDILEDLLGSSIVTTDGDKWFHQRKTASKFFTAKALRLCMTSTIRKNMDQVYNEIEECVSDQRPVDLLKLFNDFTLQTFAEVGLGVELKLIGNHDPIPLEDTTASPNILRRMRVPTWYWKLERWLNVGPEGRVASVMASVRAWVDDVVHQSLETAAARLDAVDGDKVNDTRVMSVVELFLQQSGEDKEGLKAEDLTDFILTFVLTSRSTSAMALAWTFLMIVKHPRVEQRLRKELTTKIAHIDTTTTYLTTEHTAQFVYLEATIKEVLRLYPTVSAIFKEAATDTVIGGDLAIKKGELVAIHPYLMARQTSIWGPDAAEFKPERWIVETTGELISTPKFVSFGAGPRVCIGMKLALLELRVVTANLLSRYEFTLAEPNDCSHIVAVELMPAMPLRVHAKRTSNE